MTAFNLPLKLNTTKKFLSLMFQSNAVITILSQHLFTARKRSLDFILNRTHLHLESPRLTSSEHSLSAVSASVSHPLCGSLPWMILRIFLSRNGYPRGIITYNMNDVVTRIRNKQTKRSYRYGTQNRCFPRFSLSGTPE